MAKKIVTILNAFFFLMTFVTFGRSQSTERLPPASVFNDCELNKSVLSLVADKAKQLKDVNEFVIIVASAGKQENFSKVNYRRTYNLITYLSSVYYIPRGKLIIAESRKPEAVGKLEIYCGGYLTVIINFRKNDDLIIGGIGNCDGPDGVYYPTKRLQKKIK